MFDPAWSDMGKANIMRAMTISLLGIASVATLVLGCASTTRPAVPAVNQSAALQVTARLMTPKGTATGSAGNVHLGADPRFALRLDVEQPAYIYLLRCSEGACQVEREARKASPGVPLLVDGPGGWLTMNQRREELRLLAAAAPLSTDELAARAVPMTRREPETSPPEKRVTVAPMAVRTENGVAMLTILLRKI